ncbi:hypothetical protein PFISCL1PPCAC_8230 [Pristionchus fissidentatus]|uniref:Hint domain-containing protein n=1 Tax=Pristionchus fissidentatus TaxID=1538716 RepID=A0AAV5VFC2_9BILA|nr:hypothetical protein PFISCL1PPCAC_8230 [Pristionchus fissidentatus]
MIRRLIVLLSISSTLVAAGGGSCGSGAIPFRFEVSAEGEPVLGCATPQCFGYGSGGEGEEKYTESVFLREGDDQRRYLRFKDASPERARCSSSSDSQTCAATVEWVGGFEYDGVDLKLQCCRYDSLKYSAEVGRPVVHAGEVYSGGEVLRDGRQTGFDLIKNVRKISGEDGSVAYELTVARMNCLPDPPEELIEVEINQREEIARILDKVVTAESNDDVTANLPPPPNPPPVVERHQPIVEAQPTSAPIPIEKNGAVSGSFDEVNQNSVTNYQPPSSYNDRYVQVGEQITPVITPGYYYPVQSCSYSWCQSMPACFTGEMEVETSRGLRRMDQLSLGEEIITIHEGTPAFTKIVSWQHRLPKQEATFLRIITNMGEVVEMTPLHFIWKADCDAPKFNIELVHAEKLQPGDCIYALNDKKDGVSLQFVNSTSSFLSTGAYSPMTSTGDLVVNGIYASCHNVIQSSVASQSVLKYTSMLEQAMTYIMPDWIMAVVNSPSGDTHLPVAAEFLLSIAQWCLPTGIVVPF